MTPRLVEKLKAAGFYSPKVAQELDSFWFWGPEKLSDPNLKEAVIYFLEEITPIQFFICPSGKGKSKNHPHWQQEEAGTLRHITESCILMRRVALSEPEFTDTSSGDYKFRPEALDVLLAATILSDTFKYQIGPPFEGSDPFHGQIVAEKWIPVGVGSDVDLRMVTKIAECCHYHFGRFTRISDGSNKPDPQDIAWKNTRNDPYIRAVHTVDFLNSYRGNELIYDPKEKIPKTDLEIKN